MSFLPDIRPAIGQETALFGDKKAQKEPNPSLISLSERVRGAMDESEVHAAVLVFPGLASNLDKAMLAYGQGVQLKSFFDKHLGIRLQMVARCIENDLIVVFRQE